MTTKPRLTAAEVIRIGALAEAYIGAIEWRETFEESTDAVVSFGTSNSTRARVTATDLQSFEGELVMPRDIAIRLLRWLEQRVLEDLEAMRPTMDEQERPKTPPAGKPDPSMTVYLRARKLQSALENFANAKFWSDREGCLQWMGTHHAMDFARHVLNEAQVAPLPVDIMLDHQDRPVSLNRAAIYLERSAVRDIISRYFVVAPTMLAAIDELPVFSVGDFKDAAKA